MLENHNSLSIESIMNELVRIGDYELLEKRNERYVKTEGVIHREFFDEYKARNRNKVVAQTPEMAQTPERPPAKRPLPCPMDST